MIPAYKFMMGCFVAYILISLICYPLEGAFIGSSDSDMLTGMTQWTTHGTSWLILPIFGINMIRYLPQLVAGDFSVFTSLGIFGELVRLVLFGVLAFGLIWGFFTVLYPIIASGMISLAKGLLTWLR